MAERRDSGITRRAQEVRRLDAELNLAGDNHGNPGSPEWHRWQLAADLFKAALRELYEPFERAADSLRDRDDELETAIQFLEADPWCHRSGYLKLKLLRRVTKWPSLRRYQARLEDVVILRLTNPEPGLLMPTARLAAELWSVLLRNRVHEVRRTGTSAQRSAAQRLVLRVDELQRAGLPGAQGRPAVDG